MKETVEEEIKQFDFKNEDDVWEFYQDYVEEDECDPNLEDIEGLPENLTIVLEEHHGGYEGAGEDYWFVWKVTQDDKVLYWKFQGYYMSHYGREIEGVQQVKPRKKTVTVYE